MSFKTIATCKVSDAEWRRMRPKNLNMYSPVLRLEIVTDEIPQGMRFRISGDFFHPEVAIDPIPYSRIEEGKARRAFEGMCSILFPWRIKMRQRQVLSGARRR